MQVSSKFALKVITFLKDTRENNSGMSGDLECICSGEEVNNISANQRTGETSGISNRSNDNLIKLLIQMFPDHLQSKEDILIQTHA
jgi:hypothetical protein